jgi:hypothetical protein
MPDQKDDHPLYAAINAKLAEVAAASPTPPAWYKAWASLGPQSTKEERLAVYQAVRAAGSVPASRFASETGRRLHCRGVGRWCRPGARLVETLSGEH